MTGDSRISAIRAQWRHWLLDLPRYTKRAVLVALDFLLLSFAMWGSVSLRYGEPYFPESLAAAALLLSGPLITLATFWQSGLYRLVTRFIGYRGATRIFLAVGLSVLIWSLLVFMSGQLGVPRTAVIGYAIAAAVLIVASRQGAGLILMSAGIRIPNLAPEQPKKPVIIYGAGQMGVQLLHAARRAGDREVAGFLDTSPSLWGQYVGGVKVYPPRKLERLIKRAGVREVLLALPGALHRERRQILQELERFPVEVKILPAYEDIASGRVGVNDLRPVEVGDLLGRDPVEPSVELLGRSIRDKSILVTGAGGSIGSELVRQIIKQAPRRVVLLDVSEVALYQIGIEAEEIVEASQDNGGRPEIITALGSVLDSSIVGEVMRANAIETIYHAAAYKHVPIVEHNPIVGLTNNVLGTAIVAECARSNGVERMVLISTDKAVRPTNVMGASKRLAEMVLQAAAAGGGPTVFTMVRFGNVLDSSGSVVRRFRKQIERGGPVTVTHPDVTRYFMSIPEAAELVIQAGAMAKGGEVFVLHMGEPVKINDLARHMIHLSGLEVRDEQNPTGDISVVYTGLRPGEKLYEELLIGEHTTTTEHARILKSDEPYLSPDELAHELNQLKAAMAGRDLLGVQAALIRTVEGYRPRDAEAIGESAPTRPVWGSTSRTLH